MTDNITNLDDWRAQQQPERWPIPDPFGAWLMATEPGPQQPCPHCGTWSLRRATPPDQPAAEQQIVCTMVRCTASPFYRDGTP